MYADRDARQFADLIAPAYENPRTEEVAVPPPPPETREFEEDVLEDEVVDGEKRKVPRKRKVSVTISAADYPEKTINLNHATKRTRTVEREFAVASETNNGIAIAAIFWAIAAITFLVAIASETPGWFAITGICFLIGLAIYHSGKESVKKTEKRKVEVEEWKLTPKPTVIKVDEKYKPRTKTRIIPNPERVAGIGRIEMSFPAVAWDSGSMLVDGYRLFDPIDARLPILERADDLKAAVDCLTEIVKELPELLGEPRVDVEALPESAFADGVPLRGEEVEMHAFLGEATRAFADVKEEKVQLRVVPARNMLVASVEPVSGAPTRDDDGNVERLRSLLERDRYEEIAGILRPFSDRWQMSAETLAVVRNASLADTVAWMSMEFGNTTGYTSFNFYCPRCLSDAIDDLEKRDYSISAEDHTPVYFSANTRCVYDFTAETWRCPMCDTVTDQPIPIHKLLDDVFFPAYDRLIAENQKARFDLDNKTRDDEMEYRNQMSREAEERTRSFNRDSGETQSHIQILQAEIEGEVQAIDALNGIMRLYQMEQSEVLRRVTEHGNDIRKAVSEEMKKILERERKAHEEQMQSYGEKMVDLSLSKRAEDAIRDAIQLDICMSARRTASATERTADNTDQIRKDTGRIANATERTADNTDAIRKHTGRMADGIDGLNRKMDLNNKIHIASNPFLTKRSMRWAEKKRRRWE